MTPAISVLIVDDDPLILSALRRNLKGSAARLRTAATAEEAIQLIDTEVPDLVVSDFQLGAGMDGVELLGQVGARYPGARLVLHTGEHVNPRVVGSGFEVWEKPCSSAALLALVRELAARLSPTR